VRLLKCEGHRFLGGHDKVERLYQGKACQPRHKPSTTGDMNDFARKAMMDY